MKIVFLTRLYLQDVNIWSGTLSHIYQKLKESHRVEIIGTEIFNQLSFFQSGNFPANTFIPADRYVKPLGRLLSERINHLECDLVFLVDFLYIPSEINIPIVLFSDMTFEQVNTHYKKFDKRHVQSGIRLEKSALTHAFHIIYSSEWIKQKAIEFYHINPEKIEVVEFGANIPEPTDYSVKINMDICRLVFIGKDWERKGGDKLLHIYEILKNEGFPCTLIIIGSGKKNVDLGDPNAKVYPVLDKSRKEDLDKLCKILSESHFLVLPTTFDAFGIVFCEASAYALPSITANVGGVGQAVRDGKNGYLLPADATAYDYAKKIKDIFRNKEDYLKLRQSSRIEYETRLNWDVWGEKVNRIMVDAVRDYKQLKTKKNTTPRKMETGRKLT